jgi:hypothetical protein
MGVRLSVVAFGVLEACGSIGDVAPRDHDARFARSAAVSSSSPSCELLALCADLALDPGRCVDDPAWFDVVALDGTVVDIRLSPGIPIALLAPGTWYTAVGSADDCASVVVRSFDVAAHAGDAL